MKAVKIEDIAKISADVLARQKLAGVKPIRLTKLEQFALGFIAHVPMNIGAVDSKNVSMITTGPMGIAWNGRKFTVFYRAGAT
jgi:hypothetical protein